MKICYFGTYRANYSRNQIMIAGLRAAGVEVVTCHVPLWHGIEDREAVASGRWFSLAFVKRLWTTYSKLLTGYFALRGRYDVLVLGYPGQLDVFLARLLTWFDRKPLVLDLFMSIYLIAQERNLTAKSRLSINLLRLLERVACRLPDRLISDTAAYRAWHCQTHGLRPEKFRLVPTGADDRIFQPAASLPSSAGSPAPFRIVYYGTFIPNHGLETIVAAARLLKDQPDIVFELIGDGPDKARAEQLAADNGLTNITFPGWLEKADLLRRAGTADLLLGAFGTTPQSLMTVQNKIYEGLAMARPVLTGSAPTVAQTLTHGEHLYLCRRSDPADLAQAIYRLKADSALRQRLAESGYQYFSQNFALYQLGLKYAAHLRELVQ